MTLTLRFLAKSDTLGALRRSEIEVAVELELVLGPCDPDSLSLSVVCPEEPGRLVEDSVTAEYAPVGEDIFRSLDLVAFTCV